MTTLLQYVGGHKFYSFVLVISLSVLGYYLTRPPSAPNYETALVAKGDVVQEVSVTGRVSSESEAQLAFEKGGRIVSLPREVGERVARGDALVRLDASELSALSAQARANIAFEVANLAQLKRGSRTEDVAVSESTVASAVSALDDARTSLADKIASASTVADDAIFNKTDYLFDNPRATSPRALFPVTDQKLVTSLEQSRAALTHALEQLKLSESNMDSLLVERKQYFSSVRDYLDDLASAINAVLASSQNPQATIEAWKASVSLARTNMNTAQSALLLSEQGYRSAQSAVLVAQNQLALKKVGPTLESVSAQEAKISAMQATLANYDAQIAKMTLRAPFAGVVTKQNAILGETASPNVVVVSLMSDGKFQIEANVPEVDVAKISVGDEAIVTLDAYGSDVVFSASVAMIDPAETIIEGVSTYKITLRFSKDDERIRSGMTANIDISTDKKEGVLYIPLRAVATKDAKKFVRIPFELGEKEIEVTLGLRGSNGVVEVASGLTLGQSVIIFSGK